MMGVGHVAQGTERAARIEGWILGIGMVAVVDRIDLFDNIQGSLSFFRLGSLIGGFRQIGRIFTRVYLLRRCAINARVALVGFGGCGLCHKTT